MITLHDLRPYEDGRLFEDFCRHALNKPMERFRDLEALIFAEQSGNKSEIAYNLPDVKNLLKKAITAFLKMPFSDEDKATWRTMDKALDTTNDSVGLFLMLKQGWELYLKIKPPMAD